MSDTISSQINHHVTEADSNAKQALTRKYTRLKAVEAQLEMAVRARLQFDDPASAMTLAGAAERVLSDLKPDGTRFSDENLSIYAFVETHVKPEHQKDARKYLRNSYDYLRHADKSPDGQLNLELASVDTILMLAIREFGNQNASMTPVMHAFRAWAAATNDDWGFEGALGVELLSDLRRTAEGRPDSEIFGYFLAQFESKSQIPNPKSLQEQAQP